MLIVITTLILVVKEAQMMGVPITLVVFNLCLKYIFISFLLTTHTFHSKYHGESAFSESESASIRDSLAANRGRIKAFISIHSNRQVWMTPYGYSLELPPDYDEMLIFKVKCTH